MQPIPTPSRSIVGFDYQLFQLLGVADAEMPGLLESTGAGVSARTIKRILQGTTTSRQSTQRRYQTALERLPAKLLDAIYNAPPIEASRQALRDAPRYALADAVLKRCLHDFICCDFNNPDLLPSHMAPCVGLQRGDMAHQVILANLCVLAGLDAASNMHTPSRSDFIDCFPCQENQYHQPMWLVFQMLCVSLGAPEKPLSRARLAEAIGIYKNELDRWANAKSEKGLPTWKDLQNIRVHLEAFAKQHDKRLNLMVMLKICVARILQHVLIEYRSRHSAGDAESEALRRSYLQSLADWHDYLRAEESQPGTGISPLRRLFDISRLKINYVC